MKHIIFFFYFIYLCNGQSQTFSEIASDRNPIEGVMNGSTEFADIDGDIDMDVVITGTNMWGDYITKLYINDGDGSFSEMSRDPFQMDYNSSISFADIDGDSDIDVAVSGIYNSKEIRLYVNDGVGSFSKKCDSNLEDIYKGTIEFADIDGDSDQDIFITGYDDMGIIIAKLYVNDGVGNYSEISANFSGFDNGSIAFADIDGDSDQDLLITGSARFKNPFIKLYTNDGLGNYTEVNQSDLTAVDNGAIAFCDVENDGDKDLLIIGDDGIFGDVAKFYFNDGNGSFSESLDHPFPEVSNGSIAFADIDGDTDQDVLITGLQGNLFNNELICKLYKNDGLGSFTEIADTPFEGLYRGDVEFSDIDGDSDLDVLIIGANSTVISKLYVNNGFGIFSEVMDTPFEGMGDSFIEIADFDQDNDNDILIAGIAGVNFFPTARLYANDGTGFYSEVTRTPFIGVTYSAIDISDFDGDSDQDLLIFGKNSFAGYSSILYINDGSGSFSEKSDVPFMEVDGSMAISDVDGDSDQDVLINGVYYDESEWVATTNLYINDGSGVFSELTDSPFMGFISNPITNSIYFADIDDDIDDDIILIGRKDIASNITANVYNNNGAGNFSIINDTTFQGDIRSPMAFADIDGDSDQDVLIAEEAIIDQETCCPQRVFRLFINDGLGGFSESPDTPFDGIEASCAAFADIDGDSDQDVIISGNILDFYAGSELTSRLFINDGDGTFSVMNGTPFEGVTNGSITFADIDGDSDQDVLIIGKNTMGRPIAKLYENTTSIVSSTKNESYHLDNIKIYPNPTESGLINLEYYSEHRKSFLLKLVDITGKLISNQIVEIVPGLNTQKIDFNNLKKGVYFTILDNGGKMRYRKIIVQ